MGRLSWCSPDDRGIVKVDFFDNCLYFYSYSQDVVLDEDVVLDDKSGNIVITPYAAGE